MTISEGKNIVKRKIIEIDEELCTGCGQCIISCAEGALEIIEGKAKVVKDMYCDGLGACIGECPEGALKIIEREAEDFNEEAVEQYLEGLRHKEQAKPSPQHASQCNCPSSAPIVYTTEWSESDSVGEIPSALRQWPTKLTLVSPTAPYFNNEELVLVSDCAPVAYGDFHRKILKGKPIVTACPMLGLGENELVKLEEILKSNPITKLNLILMEVSCCQKIKIFLDPILNGIDREIRVEETIIGRDGTILKQGKL